MKRPLRIESLGAGVQSTTVGLMATTGDLPPIDHAIFSDTGWERKKTYAHFLRLKAALEAAGTTVHVVSAGNIRDDHLSPDRPELFIRNPRKHPEYLGKQRTFIPVYLETVRGGERYRGDELEPEATVEELEPGVLKITTPGPDLEDPEVVAALEVLRAKAPAAVDEATLFDLEEYGTDDVRIVDTRPRVEKGIARRTCTKTYKIEPVEKRIREILGLERGQRWPTELVVEQIFGISYDELERMSTSPRPAIEHVYPLVELGMTRADCEAWNTAHGWPDVPRSSCIGCPFHRNDEWRRMRDEDPDEWEVDSKEAALRLSLASGYRTSAYRTSAYLN